MRGRTAYWRNFPAWKQIVCTNKHPWKPDSQHNHNLTCQGSTSFPASPYKTKTFVRESTSIRQAAASLEAHCGSRGITQVISLVRACRYRLNCLGFRGAVASSFTSASVDNARPAASSPPPGAGNEPAISATEVIRATEDQS